MVWRQLTGGSVSRPLLGGEKALAELEAERMGRKGAIQEIPCLGIGD